MVQLNIGDGWGDKKQELFNTHHALGAVGGIEPNRSFHPWPPPIAATVAVGAPASDWLPPAFFFLLLLLPPLLPGRWACSPPLLPRRLGSARHGPP
jgi:hypothetical protein